VKVNFQGHLFRAEPTVTAIKTRIQVDRKVSRSCLRTGCVRIQVESFCIVLVALQHIDVGDGEGGGGGGAGKAHAPSPKIREKNIFRTIYKIRAFSGKNHVKFRNFVNFSDNYHKNLGLLIFFGQESCKIRAFC